MLILLNNGIVFAATKNESDSKSYDSGYDAGYDYGYDRQDSNKSGLAAYKDSYKDSRAHKKLKEDIEDYNEREFREGFVDGYTDGHDDVDNADEDSDYATDLGKALGEISGANAYNSGKSSNWRTAIPKTKNISDMFGLSKQSSSYRSAFIKAFTSAFNEGYVEAYDRAAYEPVKVSLEQGVEDGEDVGTIVGAAYGSKDFFGGLDSSYKRDLPSRTVIAQQYSLNDDSNNYKDGFITGFISAYEESYNKAYRESNMDEALKKTASEIIPVSGGTAATTDKRFTVDVPSGTFYHDVNMSIITSYDVERTNYSNLIKASDSYTVVLTNLSGNLDDSKSIKLTFEYYGDRYKGGIYRLQDNRWLYIPTVIEDGKMSAKLNPKSLNSYGTTFSAFVDNNIPVFRDTRGHWAGDEIDAYVRRGAISGYGDMLFKPDNNITRAEFLTLLSRTFNWNLYSYQGNTTTFKDADTFGYYGDVINYATQYNYIHGYIDGTFKPGNPISYAEVEAIMNRVLFYNNFRWSDIANKMLYEKKERSGSFKNMNNKITRAEVAYMLYNAAE